jgi:hypothetical protein
MAPRSGRLAVAALAVLLASQAVFAGDSRLPARKKLLEYGWDVPTPEYIRANIRRMEQKPFDGVILRPKGPQAGNIFSGGRWKESDYAADFEDLRAIKWGRFTHNFLMMYSASEMDWFSDQDWDGVLSNVRLMARAARAGRCELAFDAEPYGKSPWGYTEQKWAEEKTFAEYQAMAFKRGGQFVKAIEGELPRCTLVTLFTYSLFRELMDVKTPAKVAEGLQQHGYGLYLSFLNGMLSAMGPGITITDGNEPSYYYPNSESYFDVYHAMRQGALNLIPRGLTDKFLVQTQASQALYMDYVFARVDWKGIPALWMTPEEQAKWFQHEVYYALKTADEYVWLYSEKMNWWEDKDIPPGMVEAIVAAREQIATGKPLGFKMDDIMKRVEEKKAAEIAAKLIRRTRDVPERREASLTIDGDLSDAAWQSAAKLESFVPAFGAEPADLKAATNAMVTWDADRLYLGVVCDEPEMAKLEVVGARHDDPIWNGDSLDIFLTAAATGSPYYHFILNPKNVQWDAAYDTDNDMSYDPTWQSATKTGEKSWTAEIAIPWAALKVSPQAGLTFRGNLCRQRRTGGGELSSWSQVVRGFMEPEYFGTWVLR